MLLLLDGVDEAGDMKPRIEAHISTVLARQRHVMVVTSRPAGLTRDLYAEAFTHLELCTLAGTRESSRKYAAL